MGLDLTILNVALPTLANDLQADTGRLQWFADSYGVIEKHWLISVAGVLVLALFARVQKLIDPALFRSRAFTCGGILATVATFCMFGLLFVLPQYFGLVLGADAFGTGLRLLPIIGGLLVGARPRAPSPSASR